ncbi:benzoate/H(+) symporter BenE family transporter [Sodalis sp. (in: enterobacteria)]|uniref:benzoate/H(+) symporter BenE family transporter n=1 Tax=Sodalis sp. (in: enterobacteria) TaxID=1898979 RepID=UPI003F40CF30
MSARARLSDLSLSAVIAGFIAVLVGYTSTAAIIFQAAAAAGASPAQLGGWLTMLGLGIGITSLGLSLCYKMPILTAWSTPGAALLATSLPGTPLAEAIGVFIFASGLILLCGVTGLFARLIAHIPQSIAAAMLAGILLRFGLAAFVSLQSQFTLTFAMCLCFLLAHRLLPRFAVLLALAAGLAVAAWQGDITMGAQPLHIATPQWITPRFNFTSLMGIALPFFIVTMASQNAPGVATLQAAGYPAPVSPLIAWTALASLVLAPFGGFSICIAAISAAVCLSPEAHPDPARRYMAAAAAGGFYLLTGLFGGSIGQLFSALPAPLIHTLAGLALLGTIAGSLHRALHNEEHRDAAIITFLVTASGITLLGIGAAFWGLMAGIAVWGIQLLPTRRRRSV